MRIRILAPGDHVSRSPHRAVSYLDDGVQVAFEATGHVGRLACDAERYDRPSRCKLVERYGFSRDPLTFACQWTRTEVAAKLADIPVAVWLRSPRPLPRCEMVTFAIADPALVITVGAIGIDNDGHGVSFGLRSLSMGPLSSTPGRLDAEGGEASDAHVRADLA